jgi:four helix bundle protein
MEVKELGFSFEDLEVYRMALDWVAAVDEVSKSLQGNVSYTLLDQFQRAVLSIPLNIAEGNGRWHKGEKKQFFYIARGSVFESVPIIQVIH